jgi:hypothetical protein
MKPDDKEFLNDMAIQLNETIKELVIEEKKLSDKIGRQRVEELKEFWNQELSEDEDCSFRRTLDYWDKILIQLWARTQRVSKTRAKVGHTFMKSPIIGNG